MKRALPPDYDSRVRCDTDCAEYNRMDQRCMAAARGERKDVSVYYHPTPDVLRCCEFFVPKPGAADQRPARERWPHLCALYDKEHRAKTAVKDNIKRAKEAVK